MYEYRQVIQSLGLGESCRSIAKNGLVGRHKAEQIRKVAKEQGWLRPDAELPEESLLAEIFDKKLRPSAKSPVRAYEEDIRRWTEQGIQATTIHQTLQRKYGFTGAYNCVQRLVKQVKDALPSPVTMILDFAPGECAQVDFGQGPEIIDVDDRRKDKDLVLRDGTLLESASVFRACYQPNS